jgi:hypothetical protein
VKADVGTDRLPRGYSVERARSIADLTISRERHARPDADNSPGIGNTAYRLQEDGIDDAENGRVQADAAGEGHDGHQYECRLSDPRAQGISDVGGDVTDATRNPGESPMSLGA